MQREFSPPFQLARHLVALIEIAVADVLHGSNVFF
jgi:hypothetical protein